MPNWDFERSLVGLRVQVYWPLPNKWFEGTVVRFNVAHRKWKVVYDVRGYVCARVVAALERPLAVVQDGDMEWILFKEEQDRVQLLWDHATWGLYRTLRMANKASRQAKWAMHTDETGERYWMNNYNGDVTYDDPTVKRGPWLGFDPEDDWKDTDLWTRHIDEWRGVFYQHNFTGEVLYERPDYKAARESNEKAWVAKKVRAHRDGSLCYSVNMI